MVYGVAGKILFVDLTKRTSRVETVPEAVYRSTLSGLGLGAHVLSQHIPIGADPLGPDNVLGFMSGVLVGTGAMFAGRFLVVGKSPLTGGWGDANCGGNLAPAIKQSGFDGVFFSGQASEPVYVHVNDEQVSILPAGDLWGKDTVETEDALQERHGKRARVACIGPAGEALVRFAGISNQRGRLAGRSGLGAVMGSKRLKALVVEGKQKAEVADAGFIHKQSKQVAALMPKGKNRIPSWSLGLTGWVMSRLKMAFRTDGLMALPTMGEWGTTAGNEVCLVGGDSPVRNWRGAPSDYPGRAVGVSRVIPTQRKKYNCTACPLGCGSICEIPGKAGRRDGYSETHRPEYETFAAFGSNILNRDFDSIYHINEYCNRMGLDSISTGGVVAFALDCYEHGLIDSSRTGGLALHWGDPKVVVTLIEQIVHREGIGDLLAEGVRIASERLGIASQTYAIHAGGQELPMHNPQMDPAYGVMYISDPTPGRHTIHATTQYDMFRIWTRVSWAPEPPERYAKSIRYENSPENTRKNAAGSMYKALLDSAGLCMFGAQLGADRLGIFEMLNAALGFDLSPDDYMKIGNHIQSMRQQFNIDHGIMPGDVAISPLLYGDPPAQRGPARGIHYDLYAMRSSYWEAMGWDPETGIPRQTESELAG